jgi:hypothetical protein
MSDPLALDTRTGLPDALRVLVEKYPREGWEGHPNFNGLTRFWLERHLMFRRLQGMLLAETEGGLDRARDPRQVAAQLGRLASMFLNELHGHHTIEDVHYFPALAGGSSRGSSAASRCSTPTTMRSTRCCTGSPRARTRC